ncbi:MAG: tRNA (N(6)-L-threonylcarbamoyladenosine(37)-C(2))-methylthiotransferase MtaB [Oscillospiraceae bacterium]
MRIAFYTLGCKVNQYETQLLKEHFSSLGYVECDVEEKADVYIVNSCTVTLAANKKSRQVIHRFRRINPDAIIALIGCFPQAFANEAELIKEADIISGTKDKLSISNLIDEFMQNGERIVRITPHKPQEKFENTTSTAHEEKTRAFVKIEDGCERYCAYCIIPKARGNVRSKPIDSIVEEVKILAEKGYKEVVLVGINLAMYGVDLGLRLVDAVKAVCKVEGIERVRLGSSEPMLVTIDDFVQMAEYKNVCPHFHIALQSGSDAVLKRMKRPYNTEQYKNIIDAVRENFDNPAITTDIIVGFPDETDEEFNQTIDFVKKLNLAMAHIFPYSRREGTVAYDMPNQVPESVKTKRAKILHEVCEELRKNYLKSQIGTKALVLFENTTNEYGRMGHTPNYTQVYGKNEIAKRGEIKQVLITDVVEEFCIGEIIEN